MMFRDMKVVYNMPEYLSVQYWQSKESCTILEKYCKVSLTHYVL